jgi:paraquat-inducible protein B
VASGLRGQLESASLVTGQLYVELGIHPDASPATLTERDGYKVLPTVPAPLDAVAGKLNGLLDTVGRLPLQEIANNLRDTVKGINRLVNSEQLAGSLAQLQPLLEHANTALASLDKQLVPEAASTLAQARATLRSAQALVSSDSAVVGETVRLLRSLNAASRSIKGVADYLERHPEALIKGKGSIGR